MKAIVIGAGAGGLAVSNLLAKAGYTVEVFEKNEQLGGRMGMLKKDGFTFDTGPSWYLMPEVFEQYFSLLGKKPSDYYQLQKLTPAYKVFFDYAEPITVHGNLKSDAKTFETIEPGAGKRLRAYVADAKNIYQLSLKYFLYNPFRTLKPMVRDRALVTNSGRLLGGITKPLHGYVKTKFATKQLQQIMEYAMVFLGTSPFKAPSLYRLMSYLDFEQGVFFPKGGMIQVTKALHQAGTELGVKYRTNTSVDSIVVEDGHAFGVQIKGKLVAADIVISNADLAFTELSLLQPEYQTYPQQYWDKKKAAPSALLLYIGVSGSLPNLEHHNLLFVDEWQKNFDDIYSDSQWPKNASMYFSKTSATDASTAPKNHENIFVLVPLPPGKMPSPSKQKKLVDNYLQQLSTAIEVPDFVQRIVSIEVRGPGYFDEAFHSWQHSALGLNHTLMQSAFLRPNIKSKKVDNLYYVGGMTQPGIGIPMCLISAELVLKSLVGDTSPGPLEVMPELR